ncbi:MAG: response regulator transcription factor [Deltaproteobacteria bacterium]|jgi:two-component system response regulator NreC|nr:response regulator transcription factor [Deltaproteobacteria bacterium]MBW1855265.1 response regulator transcription factor [Deltaproteobacteria bacterium]
MRKIKVVVADDHTILRQGIKALLDNQEGIEVVGEAKDGREAIKTIEELLPDVILMDIAMPGLNGLEATRRIKKKFPKVKVVVLTMHANEEYIFQILNAGADGYLVKETAFQDLISAINAVHKGEAFMSPSISKKVMTDYIQRAQGEEKVGFDTLTTREREILQLVAEGNSNKKIAEALFISPKTVETHRAHIMDKLNIHDRAGLIKYAIRKGMINLDK